MVKLRMLCPSRGRPDNIVELRRVWDQFTADAELLVAVDDDDPRASEYGSNVRVLSGPRGLGPIINKLAVEIAPTCDAIGFLGDDHRPRTPSWDERLLAVLHGQIGVTYGNDLHQGGNLPTAVVMSSAIVRTLGYMVPPGVEHLYHDDFWRRLGEDLGCLEYLPGIIIEHCHPVAGKAVWDDGYERANSVNQYARDKTAFDRFLAERWPGDLERLRASLVAA